MFVQGFNFRMKFWSEMVLLIKVQKLDITRFGTEYVVVTCVTDTLLYQFERSPIKKQMLRLIAIETNEM